jgi:hypothetical protein
MRTVLRRSLWTIGIVALLAAGLLFWIGGLGKDNGPQGRPTYGTYTWSPNDPQAKSLPDTPRGGPIPRADGYVMGSNGNAFILPPMPPERAMDIHRKDSVARNNAIRTCFWPGPKLRPGFYSTDPDDYGIENQLPDTMNTFSTAWFKIPAGAKIVVKGEFPHMRHWSFTTYTESGVPRDVMDDDQIEPDPGSFNPFRPDVPRDASPRRYTFAIASGNPPTPRPQNTVYTLADPGVAIGMHMRNYVPDRSADWVGGVALPEVELQYDDGRLLKGDEACAATAAPLRGKQVPLAINPKAYQAMTRLPWADRETAPARPFEAEPMEMFFNREYLILKHFFPPLAFESLAGQRGGFWSNLATRYGYKFLNQNFGKVYVVHGKMPSTPKTWSGEAKFLDGKADMRYWSLCSTAAAPTGMTVDCVYDEAVLPTLDAKGNFNIVVTRAPDRPTNATEKCGVVWMEWGNGDGIPGGSSSYGSIINRHTHVNTKFKNSWFAVDRPNTERSAMGDYLPYVVNFQDKARFEALGCPVDTAKIAEMIKR